MATDHAITGRRLGHVPGLDGVRAVAAVAVVLFHARIGLFANNGTIHVGSGTGEHVVEYARLAPALTWRPSDINPRHLASITAWRTLAGSCVRPSPCMASCRACITPAKACSGA